MCEWAVRVTKMEGCDIFKIIKYTTVYMCFIEVLNHDHRQASAFVVDQLIKDKFGGSC